MSEYFLLIHSYLRWVVLSTFLISLIFLMISFKSKSFLDVFKKFHKFFAISISIQFLIGIILYGTSPLILHSFSDFGSAMKDKDSRFFLIEHNFMMIICLALSHIASSKLRKENSEFIKQFKIIGTFYLIILILFFVGIPWNRPLFRY